MTTARIALLALTLPLALGALAAGCGGSGAALQIQPYPGDRDASPRRLEALARQFENTYGCTETDTIQITGMAPGIYGVSGCNSSNDYALGCRPGPYGQICGWNALPSLAQRAGIDMNCGPEYLDIQPAGPMQRVVNGCGFRSTYLLHCGGGVCDWALNGRIEQVGPTTGATPTDQGSYTY